MVGDWVTANRHSSSHTVSTFLHMGNRITVVRHPVQVFGFSWLIR